MSRFEDHCNDMEDRYKALKDKRDAELAQAKDEEEKERINHEFEQKTKYVQPWNTNDAIQAAFD